MKSTTVILGLMALVNAALISVHADGILVNEFMASNSGTLRDEDGDSPDWVEIYNSGTGPVNLEGWFLTDRTNDLTRWRFPSVLLQGLGAANSNSYLIVFASGKNRTSDVRHLHTNFKLAASGGYLALVDPATNVVSDFGTAYLPQRTDISYGRDAADATLVGFFLMPTPGRANATSGAGFAPEVQFSRPSGTFLTNAPFALILTAASSNATIYYVIGTNAASATTVPGSNSLLYSGPIILSNTVVIRARAFAPGLLPGPITTESFLGLSAEMSLTNFISDLPLMIIHNLGAGPVPATNDQFLVVQTFDPSYGWSTLVDVPVLAEHGVFHLHGNGTKVYPKSSFSMEIEDELGRDKDVPLLGLPEDSDWVLHAVNDFEPSLIETPLAMQVSRDMGDYASRTRFVEVFLQDDSGSAGPVTMSDYNGIYVLKEKIKIDRNRVDINHLQPQDLSPPGVTGGYLFASDAAPATQIKLSAGGALLVWTDPHYSEIANADRAPQVTYISNFFTAFADALNSQSFTNPNTGYPAYVDVNSWVDRDIQGIVTMEADFASTSYYLYKPRNGLLHMGPPWDLDRSQGSVDSNTPRFWYNPLYPAPSWKRVFNDPDFRQKWVDRYQTLRLTALSLTDIFSRIDQLTNQVLRAQPRDQARWVGPSLPGTPPRRADGTGVGTYDTEIQWKKNWYSNRLDFLDGQMLGAPIFSSHGGMVSSGVLLTITLPSTNWLVYRLDGIDPRLPGGGIAAGSISNQGPTTLAITNNVRIVARSFNDRWTNSASRLLTFWSGLVAETFYTAVPPLRITEIMYHPAPEPGSTNDADSFEFIEVKNVSSAPLSLSGYRLTGGIEFTFGDLTLVAGQSAVVVKDVDAFRLRYGASRPDLLIAGTFTGNLANEGDHIVLLGPLLEPILDFNYSDKWYPATDGAGFSLVVADENAPLEAWDQASSWRPSSAIGGSPGQTDPLPAARPPILVNEVLAHTDTNQWPDLPDTIEIFNPTDQPADISGWFLTDDFSAPKKFIIPPGTIIGPGGYLTFSAADFGNSASPYVLSPFGLGAKGDDVWLFSGDGSNLTGSAHGFSFGASLAGVTFGRYVTTTGEEKFVAQAGRTLGGVNAGPKVGPIVITEISYHPIDLVVNRRASNNAVDEYIELQNISSEPVPLNDPDHRQNTWRLRGGVDYDFPPDAIVPGNGLLLVVSFDPNTNAQTTANFRTRNYAVAEAPIFGPWSGHLDNHSDAVLLVQPDVPDAGSVPYVLVDAVHYSDEYPWPAGADGTGATLQRLAPGSYGDDPTNWIAAAPTPGGALVGGSLPTIVSQPGDQLLPTERPASITLQANGSEPLRYQWWQNGSPILGGTNATLFFSHVHPQHGGIYRVIVCSGGGVASSSNFVITTRTSLQFISRPASCVVIQGADTNFTAEAIGTGTLRYQWQHSGTNLLNATNSTLTITNAQAANEGSYNIQIADDYDSLLSEPVALTILYKPVIILQPASASVPENGPISFSVAASGALPMSFRWRTNGFDFLGGTTVNSSNSSTLLLRNVATNFNGFRFSVIVTNITGQGRISSPAILTVLADTDRDGLPDIWEAGRPGFDPNDPADGKRDDDGDGMSNAAEFVAGTDYLDPNSNLRLEIALTNGVTLWFNAVSNRSYTVQLSDRLNPAIWQKLGDVLVRMNSRTEVLLDGNPATNRYYRVVTPIQP